MTASRLDLDPIAARAISASADDPRVILHRDDVLHLATELRSAREVIRAATAYRVRCQDGSLAEDFPELWDRLGEALAAYDTTIGGAAP